MNSGLGWYLSIAGRILLNYSNVNLTIKEVLISQMRVSELSTPLKVLVPAEI
jgi:hypothetical protein